MNYLKDKRIIILPDSDEAGDKYQESVAASLSKSGILFQSADFTSYGNDVRDYLKDHTVEQLIGFIDDFGWLMNPAERKRQKRLIYEQTAAVDAAVQGYKERKAALDYAESIALI